MSLISVIIPTYNAAIYLPEAISSVLNQSYQNVELIIVDDGSSDQTKDVVSSFLNDQRVRYLYQKNTGVSAARNKGIREAKGEFIAFLDADDSWLPDNLQIKLNALQELQCDFVFANIILCDENLNFIENNAPGTDQEMTRKILLWEGEVLPCPSGNLLIRRNCFEHNLKFDEKFSTAADQDFSIYLSKNYSGKYLDIPLVKYRILPNSMSKNIKRMEYDHEAVYIKAWKNNVFDNQLSMLQSFSNLFLILAGSYWKNSSHKIKALYFLMVSIVYYPPNFIKIYKKMLK